MNTMKWLVKREFWEHKGGFFWAPVWIGAIMTLFLGITIAIAVAVGNKHIVTTNGISVTTTTNLSHELTPDQQQQVVTGLANGYMGMSAPLFMVLGIVVFFFCLGALFDDRKDRSVLFWKSLPISDSATVLSKVAIVLVVAPLITLLIATATSVLSLLFICIGATASGLHGFGQVFANPNLYLAPFQIAAMLPVYALWALPTVGWLMMVSAWARTKPFLWAVGAPVLTGTLLSWFNAMFGFGWNIGWFWHHIVGRGLLSMFPWTWLAAHPSDIGHVGISDNQDFHTVDMGSLLTHSWQMLATMDLWIGVAAGAAMIYATIRLRRWRDEG